MKKSIWSICALCVLGILTVLAGCENPWMKSLTAPLYKDQPANPPQDYPGNGTNEPSPVSPKGPGVTVSPAAPTVVKGESLQFTATVTGTGNPSQEVIWSIDEPFSAGTGISTDGILTVDEKESAPTLTVRARSVEDPAQSGTATVTVEMTEKEKDAKANEEDFGPGVTPTYFSVSTADDWANAIAGIKEAGNYVITVTGNVPISENAAALYNIKNITFSLRGGGSLTYTGTQNLFNITTDQHLIIRDVTLRGSNSGAPLLGISNNTAKVTLKTGGKITGHTTTGSGGGGVLLSSGEFVMEDGEISGNTATGSGGGVYVGGGTFTMSGGTITDNTADINGGGVYVLGGTFTMSGGTIGNNKASTGKGGGVYAANSVNFTKTGGTIYGGSGENANMASAAASGHAVYSLSDNKYRDDTVTGNLSVINNVYDGNWVSPIATSGPY
jgi:hypothetical protein